MATERVAHEIDDETRSPGPWWLRIIKVMYDTYKDFSENRGTSLAAEVAFFLVLSVFPALLIVATLLGYLAPTKTEAVQQAIQNGLTKVLTENANSTIESVTQLFTEKNGSILTIAIVAALWTASRSFQALIRALNIAYDVPDPRGWFAIRAIAIVMALIAVVGTTLVLFTLVILPSIAQFLHLGGIAGLVNTLRVPIAFAVATLWMAVLYHYAPYHRTRLRADIPGAITCSVLWIVFSIGLRMYLEWSADRNQVLTALGGALVAMLWVYLMTIAVVIGAELNSVMWRHGIDKAASLGKRRTWFTRPARHELLYTGPVRRLPTFAAMLNKFRSVQDRFRPPRSESDDVGEETARPK